MSHTVLNTDFDDYSLHTHDFCVLNKKKITQLCLGVISHFDEALSILPIFVAVAWQTAQRKSNGNALNSFFFQAQPVLV